MLFFVTHFLMQLYMCISSAWSTDSRVMGHMESEMYFLQKRLEWAGKKNLQKCLKKVKSPLFQEQNVFSVYQESFLIVKTKYNFYFLDFHE